MRRWNVTYRWNRYYSPMNICCSLIAHLNDNIILNRYHATVYQVPLFLTNIQGGLDSQSLRIRRPRNMSWLTLWGVVQLCVSQINSAGHTPLPYVKGLLSFTNYKYMRDDEKFKLTQVYKNLVGSNVLFLFGWKF